MRSSVGRIRRGSGVHIYMHSQSGRDSWRITFRVMAVILAVSGDIFALGGLRELPDLSEANAAFGRTGRLLWKSTTGRGWAGIVDRPVNNLSPGSALANIF